MAGIGFRLRRMLDRGTYASAFRAYLYSALISSGPWLITIAVIAMLGFVTSTHLSFESQNTFRISVIYVYAFSLITTGLLTMPLTRYVADLLYTTRIEAVFPTYAGALIVAGIAQSVFGAIFCFVVSGWGFFYAFNTWILYISVSLTWIAIIFLSTARDYSAIGITFAVSGALSVLAAWLLSRFLGLDGCMAGFTAGQCALFIILTIRLSVEFKSDSSISFEFLSYLKKFPELAAIGFFYNFAIWVDKFVFWYSPAGHRVTSCLNACELYDAIFISYLTIVPAMSIFMIRVETSFYEFYKGYYNAIVSKQNYVTILSVKEKMIASLKNGAVDLIKVQGAITFLFILAIPYLIVPLKMSWLSVGILRICTLTAFIHALKLFLQICLLYFEFRREAMILVITFFVLNTTLSILSIYLGEQYWGYGYFAATFITLFIGVLIFDYKIQNLEYITFVRQPEHY